MKDPRGFLFLFLLVFIFILAMVSGYKIPSMVGLNKDVLLMLSPYGIIEFLILNPAHELRPYFFEKPPVRFNNLNLIVFTILPVLIVSVWILRFPREPK